MQKIAITNKTIFAFFFKNKTLIINLHDNSIYQLSHIYMVNHINMFVIMLTCWHYDINQPKSNFHLLVIREAVVHAS